MVMDEGVVGDSCLGSGLMYWLTRRKISMEYRWREGVVLDGFIN